MNPNDANSHNRLPVRPARSSQSTLGNNTSAPRQSPNNGLPTDRRSAGSSTQGQSVSKPPAPAEPSTPGQGAGKLPAPKTSKTPSSQGTFPASCHPQKLYWDIENNKTVKIVGLLFDPFVAKAIHEKCFRGPKGFKDWNEYFTKEILPKNPGMTYRTWKDQHDSRAQRRYMEERFKVPDNYADWNAWYTKNVINPGGPKRRLIGVLRHAQGQHNYCKDHCGTKETWPAMRILPTCTRNPSHNLLDAELTEKGLRQAESAGKELEHLYQVAKFPVPDRVYMSPLRRARNTAALSIIKALSIYTVSAVVLYCLREVLTGNAADLLQSEKKKLQPAGVPYNMDTQGEENEVNGKAKLRSEMFVKGQFMMEPRHTFSVSHSFLAKELMTVVNKNADKKIKFQGPGIVPEAGFYYMLVEEVPEKTSST